MISYVSFLVVLNLLLLFFFDTFSKIISLYDIPDGIRKLHKKKIPSIGGFIFFINFLAIVLLLNFFNIAD